MSSGWKSIDDVFISAIEYLRYREYHIYAEIDFKDSKLFLHNPYGMVKITVKNNTLKSTLGELSYVDESFDLLEYFQTICICYGVKLSNVELLR